jgi:hypothetical protein
MASHMVMIHLSFDNIQVLLQIQILLLAEQTVVGRVPYLEQSD